MVCVGASAYFHVHNIIPVSVFEDLSQTSEVENVKFSNNGFGHLLGLARIGPIGTTIVARSRSLICRVSEGEFQIGQSHWHMTDALSMRQMRELTLPK